MEADSAVPSRITVMEGPGTGTKISLAALPPPPPMHQPTSWPQSASGSDNTVPRTQSSDTEKKQLEQQLVSSPRPSQAPRSPKTPPNHPEIVDDTTVQPEMESFQTPDTVAVIQGDGHQNSLLLYRLWWRLQRPPPSPQDRCDWLARQEERQGTTDNAATPSIVPDTDPHETGGTPDSPPLGQMQTEESPEAPFIPASISLLPTSEVALCMGAGNGVLPSPS